MIKQGAVIRIIVWSVVAVLLLAVMLTGILGGFSMVKMGNYWTKGQLHEVFSTQESAANISGVNIVWHAGNVTVTQSADDQMHLKQTSYYDVSPADYNVSGGQMSIRQEAEWGIFFLGLFRHSSDLQLSLPAKQYEAFVLKMTSGDTTVDKVSAKRIGLDMTSGDLKVVGLKTDSLDVTVTSGRLTADTVTADKLSFDVTSGNASVSGAISAVAGNTTSGNTTVVTNVLPKMLDVTMTSGDVSVTIPENDGFTLNCHKTSGNIRSDFDLLAPINGNKNTYTYHSGGTAGLTYSAQLTSGTFELLKAKA